VCGSCLVSRTDGPDGTVPPACWTSARGGSSSVIRPSTTAWWRRPTTSVTGDWFASIYDLFGHRWAVMTRAEDVSPEEAERRLAGRAAAQS
jgi:hypothetical protein